MSTTQAKSAGRVHETAVGDDVPTVAIQVSRNAVVASIQVDLADDVLARFREDLLQRIHDTDASGVIFDLSGLEIMDSHEFAGLRKIITMSKIMGAECVLVGLKPGVVSALIQAGAEVDGLLAAPDLDSAYALLAAQAAEEVAPASELEDDNSASVPDAQEPEAGQVPGLQE